MQNNIDPIEALATAERTLSRRRFGQLLGLAGAFALVDRATLGGVLGEGTRKLSALNWRTASAEGEWPLSKIEGRIPKDLHGTLYRVAPGQRENHGVALRHLFDGDPFLAAYRFDNGKASLRARFLDTPQRVEELKAGRMLYNEFGTLAPPPPAGWKPGPGKNQPSVNIIPWDGRLLGLSEGGHPTAIDPNTLAFQSIWDFHGTLPANVPFTAHPRFDPKTGVGYGYAVGQGPGTPLHVYRMETNGHLTELYNLPQSGYFIIHDMLLTEQYIVLIAPPARFDFALFFSGEAKVAADAVKYLENEPMRVILLRKDGKGDPVVVNQPSSMLFHNGNAHERNGKIVLETLLAPDGSALLAVYSFGFDTPAKKGTGPRLIRMVVDPATGAVESRTVLDDDPVEFPRYDLRRTGDAARVLYTVAFDDISDTFAGSGVVRRDLATNRTIKTPAGKGRMFGEPVFTPHPSSTDEAKGWILVQGYDGARDENFLEIHDAATLDVEARIWTGIHFPLGFHGNFVAAR